MDKIITIQKNLKSFYYRKLYKKIIKNPYIVKYEPSTHILISAFLNK